MNHYYELKGFDCKHLFFLFLLKNQPKIQIVSNNVFISYHDIYGKRGKNMKKIVMISICMLLISTALAAAALPTIQGKILNNEPSEEEEGVLFAIACFCTSIGKEKIPDKPYYSAEPSDEDEGLIFAPVFM